MPLPDSKKSECETTLISDKDLTITASLRWFRKMKQKNKFLAPIVSI
jgi:hypothetical protein